MLKILLLSVAIIAASTQYDNAWVLTLKRTPSCVKIAPLSEANQQKLLIGHTDGEVELIDAHNGSLLVSARLFKDKIEQIEIDNPLKISFIRSGHSLAVIDSDLNILEMLSFQHKINSILRAGNSNSQSILFVLSQDTLTLFHYQHTSSFIVKNVVNFSLNSNISHIIASKNHKYLYSFDESKQSFTIYALPELIHESKDIKLNLSSYIEVKRSYNFRIDYAFVDDSEGSNLQQELMIVEQNGTIFYVRAGNIISYLPYFSSEEEQLVGVDYCQLGYIAVLHRIHQNENRLNYLTLVRKEDLFSDKVSLLQDFIEELGQLNGLQCNNNLILIQQKGNRLFLFEGFKQFDIYEYLLPILSLTILIIFASYYLLASNNLQQHDFQQDHELKQHNTKNDKTKDTTSIERQDVPKDNTLPINKKKQQ